jgi:hypothetical protein
MLRLLLVASYCIVCLVALQATEDKRVPATHPLFQSVVTPSLPVVRGVARTALDRFILSALEARHLSWNPEADKATLLRRVCFDLTGLPPSVAELDAFLKDTSVNAYENMVDRYLASPRYGERWGKYWLDAAGYADSNGYFNADSDRPLAWKYRDYVVNSFNADKPYDQFVREQLAGDELVGYTPTGDVTPAMVEQLVATHFLRNAPDGSGESDGNPDEVRTDRFTVLEGNTQIIMNCLLGLTVQCARCHDHKFEPISQKEYYSLQAILYPVYNPDRWKKPNDRVVVVGIKADLEARQRLTEQVTRQIKALKEALAAYSESLREQLLDERLKVVDATTRTAILDAVKVAKDKRTAEQKKLLKNHARLVDISEAALEKRFPAYGSFREQLKRAIAEREKEKPVQPEKLACFVETDTQPAVHHLLKRGLHNHPTEEVQPGVPGALQSEKNRFQIASQPGRVTTGRRTALARWLTAAENPLFARVMVNRVWQHHFGTGLVATVDNLGQSGAKPSHPELLDYLAAEFIRNGWSLKTLHRQIMHSAVYRQSSAPRQELEKQDPENRLLGRFPLRRLDAEAVRDAMLFVSDELDTRSGGPAVPSQRTAEGIVQIDDKAEGRFKRSVYLQQRRTQVVTFLQLFDVPTMVTTCGARSPSTVPLQSLALLNSEFVRGRGKSLATRLLQGTSQQRLDMAYRLVCSRSPTPEERQRCEAFLTTQRTIYRQEKDAEARAWADLCQMLLSSNAFLYVE